tara:strand:- start:68 stop:223 length:156 start_codon:yes stop_codon:yes gene_type:complete
MDKRLRVCSVCQEPNHLHAFSCESCGFDLDFKIEYNKWGLPHLIPRKNESN